MDIYVIVQQVLFILAVAVTGWIVYKRAIFIKRNIQLGRSESFKDNPGQRLKKMLLIAFGQKKMFKRPIPAILHLFIYLGFILINIEILEIIIDGITGQHRVFKPLLGNAYNVFISIFELLALFVIIGCVAFLWRRNVIKMRRFWAYEMTKWPRLDANLILIFEIILMTALMSWNASDQAIQNKLLTAGTLEGSHYVETGRFWLSGFFVPIFEQLGLIPLIFIERAAWWVHILGIFAFGVYVTYSKHLHIALAFPNTYFTRLRPQGMMDNMASVTKEIKLMMDPSAPVETAQPDAAPVKFGAADADELSWRNLLDAYSCTECGRCTSACPANMTGKLLSPRKIMMDTRDRIEEIGYGIDKNGKEYEDGKKLIGDYISVEELRACTACQACVEECPVNINPLDIIYRLRRNLIMEESNSPQEWNLMFTNVENNAAPWQFSPSDRLKWADELTIDN